MYHFAPRVKQLQRFMQFTILECYLVNVLSMVGRPIDFVIYSLFANFAEIADSSKKLQFYDFRLTRFENSVFARYCFSTICSHGLINTIQHL